jgi:hypothetical protein
MISNKFSTIFNRNLKLYKGKYPDSPVTITPGLRGVIYTSMFQIAKEVRQEQDLKELREGFKIIPRLFWTRLTSWVKRYVRNQYCKVARLRADTENYKCYVVQGRGLTFKIFSTRDYKYNKRIRVFKKDLTAKEMEEISCFVAWPKKR